MLPDLLDKLHILCFVSIDSLDSLFFNLNSISMEDVKALALMGGIPLSV